MAFDRDRWLPGFLIRRWGALLWIGPLLGLLTGLVLVFGFLKENGRTRTSFDVGFIPEIADAQPYLAELREELASEVTLMQVRQKLGADGRFLQTPVWWLRPRVAVSSSNNYGGFGEVDVTFIHHSEVGRERLEDAFGAVVKNVVPRVRARYVKRWRESIDARLVSIEELARVQQIELNNGLREDFPAVEESDQLVEDLEVLSMDESMIGSVIALPGSFGGPPPWWKSPPAWAILIGKCVGYGLLAVFPAIFLLEALRPRRKGCMEVGSKNGCGV